MAYIHYKTLSLGVIATLVISCKSDKTPATPVQETDTHENFELLTTAEDAVAETADVDTAMKFVKHVTTQTEEAVPAKEEKKTPPKKKKKRKPKPQPKVEFEQLHYDFGQIVEGDTTSFKFKFKNVGKVPINVDKADATCGCARPSFPFLPIAPGETGHIGVQYISIGKQGEQNPEISFYYNNKKDPIILTMSGYVEERPKEESSETATIDSTAIDTIK